MLMKTIIVLTLFFFIFGCATYRLNIINQEKYEKDLTEYQDYDTMTPEAKSFAGAMIGLSVGYVIGAITGSAEIGATIGIIMGVIIGVIKGYENGYENERK